MNNEKVLWNADLIGRYDLAGPRYTSYPTAPHFQEHFSRDDVDQAIARGNQAARPLSLYFHIPFCDTICYYCGCNKVVTANKKRAEPYLTAMYQEISLRAKQIQAGRPVHQLHWGGGTPTFISDQEKRQLMAVIGRHFELLSDDTGEYSIEIHPGGLEVDTLGVLRELGFNRLSMGVQDFNPRVQTAVNRFNSYEEVRLLSQRAKYEGFLSLSMDLIYGLPHQTVATVTQTLEQIIALGPERLSLFNYAHMPHLFKSQRQMDESALPAAEEKLRILEQAVVMLQEAGYVYIGMDHFARPDDALTIAQQTGTLQRNFQGYATHGNCDLLAFGVSAISSIDNVFVQNEKAIARYIEKLAQQQTPQFKGLKLTREDQLRQAVINQLICHFKLDFESFNRQWNIHFTEHFADALTALAPMGQDGLVTLTDQSLTVTTQGRLLIRRICMAFDEYLSQKPEIKYSKIV